MCYFNVQYSQFNGDRKTMKKSVQLVLICEVFLFKDHPQKGRGKQLRYMKGLFTGHLREHLLIWELVKCVWTVT
jgi:hypothetical protein